MRFADGMWWEEKPREG